MIRNVRDLRSLLVVLAGAGLIYSALIAYEVRMSPQLHQTIYGFFQHDWLQVIRTGAYRPVVFMPHGLALALFLATSVGAWASLGRLRIRLFSLPARGPFLYLIVLLALCKSLAALVYGALLALLISVAKPRLQMRVAVALCTLALLYPTLRLGGLFPLQTLESVAYWYFIART